MTAQTRPLPHSACLAPSKRVVTVGAAAAAMAALAAGCTSVPLPPAAAQPNTPTATVLRTVDGDTVDVIDDTRGRIRLRLLGIDAPEVHRPGMTVGCYGPEAAEYAKAMLTGQRVAIVMDPSQDSHDRYGRTLAYVQLADGRDFGVEAARAGMVHEYVYGNNPVKRYPQIAEAVSEAKAASRGLWGPPCWGETSSVPTGR
jgi:micrococcal nuclease